MTEHLVTVEQFERAVEMKSGRIGDLSKRLGIKESELLKLISPASRVYIGERGWLKVREKDDEH